MWGSTEEPIVVLHVESPNRGGQGDSVYRTEQPCRALGQLPGVKVVAGSFLSPLVHQLLPVADVVVLCDVVEADLFPIIRHRRARGLPTIYEINDDFQAPQAWSASAYLAHNPITRSLSSQLAVHCDGVQFSTPYLAERFSGLSPHRAVFMNQLWQMPASRPGQRGTGIRIGWGGSVGHKEDFRKLVDVVGPLLARYNQTSFAVMGPGVFWEMCKHLPNDRLNYTPGGSLADYLSFVATLDIGVCPLEATDFNRGRSDVKFLEYASHGVVTVAARLAPYQASLRDGETGIFYDDESGLMHALAELIQNGEMRRRIGKAGRKYVESCRVEAQHAVARLQFMRACRGRLQTTPAAATQVSNDHCRTFADSSAQICKVDDLTSALLEGLAATRDAELTVAAANFRGAADLAPTFYLPWLYRASVQEDHLEAIKLLQKALALAPASATGWILLADRFEALENLDAARGALERSAQEAPELGLATARLAALAERAGDSERAIALEAVALSQNPYFALPHVRRVLSVLDAGQTPNVALVERCLQLDNRYWATRFALGRVALAAGLHELAREHLAMALQYAPDGGPVLAQLAKLEIAAGDNQAAGLWLALAKKSRG